MSFQSLIHTARLRAHWRHIEHDATTTPTQLRLVALGMLEAALEIGDILLIVVGVAIVAYFIGG